MPHNREETVALEGLEMAVISQLESIDCRVVVVSDGKTEPITIDMGQGGGSEDTDAV
jgi:hypothetical protein